MGRVSSSWTHEAKERRCGWNRNALLLISMRFPASVAAPGPIKPRRGSKRKTQSQTRVLLSVRPTSGEGGAWVGFAEFCVGWGPATPLVIQSYAGWRFWPTKHV